MPKTSKRRVPVHALQFPMGDCLFAAPTPTRSASDGKEGEESPGEGRPVELLARTPAPASHPYWGRCVHDMAGFSLHGGSDRIPLDYCHSPMAILGYAEGFAADNETGLTGIGLVVPTHGQDQATDVLAKADAGVPYQCSIMPDSGTLVIEDVPEGRQTQVNGYAFAGPGVVFRQWALRGLAICPYGVDAQTAAKFAADPAETFEVSCFSQEEDPMIQPEQSDQLSAISNQAAAATTTTRSASEGAQAASDGQPDRKTEGKRFCDAFGPDRGAKYFADGLFYEEAAAQFAADLRTENESLRTRLAALGTQGEEPLSFGTAEGESSAAAQPPSKDAQHLEMALGPNLARVALSIKLPPPRK